jgi:hypothetical protein
MESKSRGVLDRPVKPGDDGSLWSGAVRNIFRGWDDASYGAASHGGGGLVIGLRCASAATVEVPIGPFWSYSQHSPIATPSVA